MYYTASMYSLNFMHVNDFYAERKLHNPIRVLCLLTTSCDIITLIIPYDFMLNQNFNNIQQLHVN